MNIDLTPDEIKRIDMLCKSIEQQMHALNVAVLSSIQSNDEYVTSKGISKDDGCNDIFLKYPDGLVIRLRVSAEPVLFSLQDIPDSIELEAIDPEMQRLYEISIDTLGLENRVTNPLKRRGLKTIGHIMEFINMKNTDDALIAIMGFGETSLGKLTIALTEHGYISDKGK